MSKRPDCSVKTIVVNATALDKNGALTILKQFLRYAGNDKRYHYYCFVPKGLDLKKDNNVSLVESPKKNWIGRIFWDCCRFRSVIKSMKFVPYKVISLQNTSINIGVEQIIYLHQSLPFSPIKWNVFKKEQLNFFLYKHFYKFFILLFSNASTIFVVQTNWMKVALCATSKIKDNQVHVIKPDIILPDFNGNKTDTCSFSEDHRLLYPATPLFYKNHQIILDAFNLMKDDVGFEHIILQVTFNPDDYPSFSKQVEAYGLCNNVQYLGTIPYSDLMERYRSASIVLFPSYIESFGLPLAEGASLKKPIICSDLPFSRDVLNGYSGAVYVNYKKPTDWAREIQSMLKKIDNNSLDFGRFDFKQSSSSWKDFFKLL